MFDQLTKNNTMRKIKKKPHKVSNSRENID